MYKLQEGFVVQRIGQAFSKRLDVGSIPTGAIFLLFYKFNFNFFFRAKLQYFIIFFTIQFLNVFGCLFYSFFINDFGLD